MVRPARLERATIGLENRCSIQLSYGRNQIRCVLPRNLCPQQSERQVNLLASSLMIHHQCVSSFINRTGPSSPEGCSGESFLNGLRVVQVSRFSSGNAASPISRLHHRFATVTSSRLSRSRVTDPLSGLRDQAGAGFRIQPGLAGQTQATLYTESPVVG